MSKIQERSLYVGIAVLSLLAAGVLHVFPAGAIMLTKGTGPFVDSVVYDIITQDDQSVLALQDGEIDLIGDWVDPEFYQELDESANIETTMTLRNGYGYITINCRDDRYPQNLTVFRRALAYALDKQAISEGIWNGLAEPLDSCVPKVNPFSAENQLTYHYYEANVEKGNQMLDAAGFDDIDEDGYREAPNGDDFDVLVEVAQSSQIAIETGAIMADAFQALGIDGTSEPTDFYGYLQRLENHGDYDMVFLGSSFDDFDVDWLAYEYWSEYADKSGYNYPNFQNASYDDWRDQLVDSIEYEKVYEAAIEMQKIWTYQCPMIICYENYAISAYRTDRFEGFVNDINDGVASWWTNQKVRLKESLGGPYGGTFIWGNPLGIDSFNILYSSSRYTLNVLNELYDPLLRLDSEGNLIPFLADDYIIETHADNPVVPDGRTRITFDIVANASWSDGSPLTAEDIAFTYDYLKDSNHRYASSYEDEFLHAFALNDYTVRMEFTSESYWHLPSVAGIPILPKNQWQGVDYESFRPKYYELITSGPFRVEDYQAGDFVELARNDFYNLMPFGDTLAKNEDAGDDDPEDLAPVVQGYSELAFGVGEPGSNVSWRSMDRNPEKIEVWRDGILVSSTPWTLPATITSIDCSVLLEGMYNFTLEATDQDGHSTSLTTTVIISGVAPFIEQPSNLTYILGTTGHQMTWRAGDDNSSHFIVYRNGSIIECGAWDGRSITIGVDGLSLGIHNYTLCLNNTEGHSSSSTVFISVVEDSTFPTINGPVDMIFIKGMTDNHINWTLQDNYPDTYRIYLDGELVRTGKWNASSESIGISLDELNPGRYNYTILVTDLGGHMVSDTVLVTVIGHSALAIWSGGIIAVIAVVGLIAYLRRR